MKLSIVILVIVTTMLHGCSTTNSSTISTRTSGSGNTSETPQIQIPTKVASESLPSHSIDVDIPSPSPAPDAIIKVNPDGSALSEEMNGRLLKIARLAKEDERIVIRLEGFVPDGGSPSWNIGAAEKSVSLVKERLESMRVPARRIRAAAFGEEHEVERDQQRHWVEIYLTKPGT